MRVVTFALVLTADGQYKVELPASAFPDPKTDAAYECRVTFPTARQPDFVPVTGKLEIK